MTKTKLFTERVADEAIESMVKVGIFASKQEAVRAAILKYAMDVGALSREDVWRRIKVYKPRGVDPEQLKNDLESIENET